MGQVLDEDDGGRVGSRRQSGSSVVQFSAVEGMLIAAH
jgi:hypothetical protein